MDLNLTDEQKMLRDTARRYLANTYHAEARRARIAENRAIDPARWLAFAEMGWLALPFAEEDGGIGGSPADVAILTEELGRAAVVEPFVESVVLAGGLIAALGDEEQKAKWLSGVIEGRLIPALAHLENGAKGDMLHVAATAIQADGKWLISGHKILVAAGAEAGLLLVSARTGDGIGLFAVDPAQARYAAQKVINGSVAADITFENAPAVRLGGEASAAIEAALDRAASAACADALGVMEALLAATVAYTKERVQFGKPLSAFQSLQHRMGEMGVKCQEARASSLLAALSAEAPRDLRIRGVSGAKAKIGKLSRHVAQEAVQLHGAIGFSEEMPIGIWFRRLYAFENTLGATQDHLARYAAVALTPAMMDAGLLRAKGEI